jgi:BirA family biotin operon repressor/biotin-[acetyl-CoA-carboxylase] ligase
VTLPNAAWVEAQLANAGHTIKVHAFDALGSTNVWLAENDISAGVCITDHQQAGHGRRGRSWQSLPGNITVSIAQRVPIPMSAAPVISLVTGIACAEALRTSTGVDVQVKWPNDLLVSGAKLGGLLHESVQKESGLRIIGGIGVNLVQDERLSALGIGGTCLAEHGVASSRRDELVATMVAAVLDAWQECVASGWGAFAQRWQAVDALAGQPVRVFTGRPEQADDRDQGQVKDREQDCDGVACGVDDSGALQVRVSASRTMSVHAGDVTVRRRPGQQ